MLKGHVAVHYFEKRVWSHLYESLKNNTFPLPREKSLSPKREPRLFIKWVSPLKVVMYILLGHGGRKKYVCFAALSCGTLIGVVQLMVCARRPNFGDNFFHASVEFRSCVPTHWAP